MNKYIFFMSLIVRWVLFFLMGAVAIAYLVINKINKGWSVTLLVLLGLILITMGYIDGLDAGYSTKGTNLDMSLFPKVLVLFLLVNILNVTFSGIANGWVYFVFACLLLAVILLRSGRYMDIYGGDPSKRGLVDFF